LVETNYRLINKVPRREGIRLSQHEGGPTKTSAVGQRAENICSRRAFPQMTHSGYSTPARCSAVGPPTEVSRGPDDERDAANASPRILRMQPGLHTLSAVVVRERGADGGI
jgi:hypothetical protein